jgi:hypothetical protein
MPPKRKRRTFKGRELKELNDLEKLYWLKEMHQRHYFSWENQPVDENKRVAHNDETIRIAQAISDVGHGRKLKLNQAKDMNYIYNKVK